MQIRGRGHRRARQVLGLLALLCCAACGAIYHSRVDETEWEDEELEGTSETPMPETRRAELVLAADSGGDRLRLWEVTRQDERRVATYERQSTEVRSAECFPPFLIFGINIEGLAAGYDEWSDLGSHERERAGSYWLFPYSSGMFVMMWEVSPALTLVYPVLLIHSIGADVLTLPLHTWEMVAAELNGSETHTRSSESIVAMEISRRDVSARLRDAVVVNDLGAWLPLAPHAQGGLVFDPAPLLALAGEDETLTVAGSVDGAPFQQGLAVDGDLRRRLRQRAGYRETAAAVDLPPRAEIDTSAPAAFVPGEPGVLKLSLRNSGKGEFQGLVAQVHSSEGSLDGLRLHFGHVAPGATAAAALTVRLPADLRAGSLPLRLSFSEANGWQPGDLSLDLPVRPLERPRLVTRWTVVDDGSGRSVGNGDGAVQAREAVELVLAVSNEGTGRARAVSAAVGSGQSGLLLGPRQELGALEPGESAEARLLVQVRPEFGDPALQLALDVRDADHGGEVLGLELPLDARIVPSALRLEPPLPLWTAREGTPIRDGSAEDAPLLLSAGAGLALDAVSVLGDVYEVRFQLDGASRGGWVARADALRDAPAGSGAAAGGPVVVLQTRNTPPIIAVAMPSDGLRTVNERLAFLATVGDDTSLAETGLLLNGVAVAVDARDLGNAAGGSSGGRQVRLQGEVQLREGRNELVFRAVDERGLASTERLVVEYAAASREAFLIAVGVDDYADPEIPDLRFAEADARAVHAALAAGLDVPPENRWLLTGAEASRFAVRDLLTLTIRTRAGPEDTVVLYFAGHGTVDPDPTRPDGLAKYFVPQDARRRSLRATALAFDDVAGDLDLLSSERVVFFSDACFSGGQGRSFNQAGFRGGLPEDIYDVIAGGEGRVFMAACGPNEVAAERDGHGLFTSALLAALAGRADLDGDGLVTFSEVFHDVSQVVRAASGGQQLPRRGGPESGQLVLSVLR